MKGLDFIGLAKERREENEIIFLAIYSCILPKISSFQPNDEIEKIEYWDFHSNIGYINEIDRYIAELLEKH